MAYETELKRIQKTFKNSKVIIEQPESDFPELDVTVPDSWETVQLAPLYDVHIGNSNHDKALFARHMKWIAETPNVLSWGGGDLIENITPAQAAKGMGQTATTPEDQIFDVIKQLAPIQHKLLFSIPGNHEDRTSKTSGMDSGKRIADGLEVPYFPDYCFLTIHWRGQNFRILAHHGAGGAQTPGAQLNSARKELAWTTADVIWTGHLHQNKVDIVFRVDYDQKTGRAFERDTLVIIAPSYLFYFKGYAAKVRMSPGVRGLTAIILNADGRIDASLHARGKRL